MELTISSPTIANPENYLQCGILPVSHQKFPGSGKPNDSSSNDGQIVFFRKICRVCAEKSPLPFPKLLQGESMEEKPKYGF
jgi:hypothetical protein